MRTFTDAAGRTWTLDVNCHVVERVRATVELDLLTALDGTLFPRLAADPMLLAGLLWTLCDGEAAARQVSPEQFAAGLKGDTLDAALEALTAAILDFFPRRHRALMGLAVAKTREAEEELAAAGAAELEGPAFRARMTALVQRLSGSFGDRPGSSESTPARGPSAGSSRRRRRGAKTSGRGRAASSPPASTPTE